MAWAIPTWKSSSFPTRTESRGKPRRWRRRWIRFGTRRWRCKLCWTKFELIYRHLFLFILLPAAIWSPRTKIVGSWLRFGIGIEHLAMTSWWVRLSTRSSNREINEEFILTTAGLIIVRHLRNHQESLRRMVQTVDGRRGRILQRPCAWRQHWPGTAEDSNAKNVDH